MSLTEKINEDLKTAMRNKDNVRLRSLRAIKSALLLAQTEKGASKEVDKDAEIKILQKLVKQRKESLDIYQKQNREDLAVKESEEIAVIESYLPEQMNEDQIRLELQRIIKESGAQSPRDMGKVMGMANKHFAGKADPKVIGTMAKEMLEKL